jgi:SpoVK/Ycf46/Vps4 family AAA+-type ATPase
MTGGIRIVFLWPTGVTVPEAIQDDIQILNFKVPSYSELLETWNRDIANIENEYKPAFDDDGVARIIRSALGMSQQEFSNSIAIALVKLSSKLEAGETEPMDFVRIILESKVNIINRTDMLELLQEGSMDQVGGLDLLKEWLIKRAAAMVSQEARDYGIDPPKGILLVGPPGGGKSLITKAIASELGVAGIKFDIGKVFASLVGKSEERTRTALAMIDAMAPCLVMFDGCDHGQSV